HELTAHNSLILCMTELGFLGYVLWLAIIILTIRNLKQLTRTAMDSQRSGVSPPSVPEEIARWATAVEVSLYGFLCAGFFLSRTYTPILFLLIALGVALAEMARRAGIAVEIPVRRTIFATTPVAALASIILFYGFIRIERLFL